MQQMWQAKGHPHHVDALIAPHASDTLVVETFTLGYQGARHRVLRASEQAARFFEGDVVARATTQRPERRERFTASGK